MRLAVRRPEAGREAGSPASPPAADSLPGIEGPALALEVGGTAIRAALVDRVAGGHRFVARGIAQTDRATAAGDVIVGIREAVAEVEALTRRRLTDSAGLVYPERPGGGLDAAVLVVGAPLRVVVLQLATGRAGAYVQAGLAGAGVLVMQQLGAAVESVPGRFLEQLLDALDQAPDALLVVGPLDRERDGADGARLRCLARALEVSGRTRPAVVSVGTSDLVVRLHAALGQSEPIRAVDVRGTRDWRAALSEELRAVWQERLASESGGFGAAQGWAGCPIVPAAWGFATALRFLAVRRSRPVLGVDVGSSTLCLVRASADGAAIHVADVGIARRTHWALSGETLGRLLPGGDPDRVRDYLWNRSVRPWAIPEGPDEEAIVRALAREAIRSARLAIGDWQSAWQREVGLVVVRGGGLQRVAPTAEGAWAIAEGLGASGLFELSLDRHHTLAGLGALASIAPLASAEVLLADGLLPLGTVAVGQGRGRPGERAAMVEVRGAGGASHAAEVLVGKVTCLPLGPRAVGELTITPERSYDFGWGRGKRVEARVFGGQVGLLVGVGERDGR